MGIKKIDRKICVLLAAGMLVTGGCGKESQEPATEAVSVEESAPAEASTVEEALAPSEAASEASSEEAPQEKSEENTNKTLNYLEYISGRSKDKVEIDDESAALYAGFLSGEEKAVFSKDGDTGQYVEFSAFLEDGKSYSLNEIVEAMTAEGQYGERWEYKECSDSYLDCGLDGNIEMLVTLYFNDEFEPSMVIKNVDGALKICFTGDSWSRCRTDVYYSGEVCSYGSGGATVHGGTYGFIDATGKYNFWYSDMEESFGDRDEDNKLTYYYDREEHEIEGADILFLESISFEENDDGHYDYYYFFLTDSDYNNIEDDPDDPANPYVSVKDILVKEQGLNLITSKEADDMIAEKRRNIGLTDEIYGYGKELLGSRRNEYFPYTDEETVQFKVTNFFYEDDKYVNLQVKKLASYENGDVYRITIDHEDCPERYYYGVTDRFNLGTFYVTEDKIYVIDGRDDIPTEEEFLSVNKVVCAEGDSKVNPDGEAIELTHGGYTCFCSKYNTLIESGFYFNYRWRKGEGLVYFRSGYGAEGDPIEIKKH